MLTLNTFKTWITLLILISSFIHANAEYHYSYIPKKVYENQIFPLTIIAIGEKDASQTEFIFDKSTQTRPLFDKPMIAKNGKDTFYTFYFQAKKAYIAIPQIFISSYRTQSSLSAKNIPVEQIKAPPYFCHVIAADITIINSQVSHYDEKHHIISLSLKALEANIEEMKLQNVFNSGVEEIKRNHAKVDAKVYAIVPIDKKELIFSYFNTIRKEFITLKVPIQVRLTGGVVAQSDLNPKQDSFKRLKKYALIFLIFFFFIMAIVKRDVLYFIIVVISFITLLTLYIPHKKICIQQGAPLYIIPTSTSTISTYIDNQHTTLLLDSKNRYHKVAYKQNIIGWIKDEDICKD